MRFVLRCAAFALSLSLAGCATVDGVADRVVAPTKHYDLPKEANSFVGTVTVGTPAATFSYFLARAGSSEAVVQFEESRFNYAARAIQPPDPSVPTRGTLVMLHGLKLDARPMWLASPMAVQAGFDALAIDLRNHGRSPSLPLTFGPEEGREVALIVESLLSAGTIKPPVMLLGYSYGATVALYAAKRLGPQVPVVAVAPFDNAEAATIGTLASLKAEQSWSLPSEDKLPDIARAIEKRLMLDLKKINTSQAVAGMPNCALIISGAGDTALPASHADAIARAMPNAKRQVLSSTHEGLMMLMTINADRLADWLVRSTTSCASLPALYYREGRKPGDLSE